MNIDPSKFIFNCTIEEFVEVLKHYFPNLENAGPVEEEEMTGPTFKGRLLYGVDGICEFFRISRKTYYNWLPWLKGAIKQNGRKPICDVEYAMKLYDKNKGKHQEEDD